MGRGGVLRVRDFRLLFISNAVSTIGNAFTSVALAFGVLDSTGSTRDIGIVLAFRLVAQVALLLVGGASADRFSRRTLLVQTAVVSGLTQSGIAALFLSHSGALWSLSALAAVNGAAAAFSAPAITGVVPQLVPANLLRSANALTSIVRNSATIGGAALAGLLVAVASPGWALAIDAASFFASAALVTRISTLPPAGSRSPMLADLREGWREFASRTWVWAIVVQSALVNVALGAALDVYAPVIAKVDLGGPGAYGVITAAVGLGGVLGGFVMLRYNPRRPLVGATLGTLISMVILILLAAGSRLWALVPAAVVSGVGIEVFVVLWDSSLQHHIPPERLSRVSAYDWLGSIAFTPIGLAVAGPVATALGGVHHAMWAVVGLIAVPTLIVFALPDIWRLRNAPDVAPAAAPQRPGGVSE